MFFETSYGLSDYVKGGATAVYQATIAAPAMIDFGDSRAVRCGKLKRELDKHFRGISFGCSDTNVNMNFTIPGDFSSDADVKGLIDGAVGSSGLQIQGSSMIRLISNPGGVMTNPAGAGAGVEPGTAPDRSWIDVAGSFWGDVGGQAASVAADKLLPKEMAGFGMYAVIAVVGIGIFFLMKR